MVEAILLICTLGWIPILATGFAVSMIIEAIKG